MANCCLVFFDYTFDTPKAADAFHKTVERNIEFANNTNQLVYIGSHTRYVGDIELNIDGCSVSLAGYVEWAVKKNEAAAMVVFARWASQGGLSSLTIDYEEDGELIYGRYTYTRGWPQPNDPEEPVDNRFGVLVNRYLKNTDWPDDKDEDENFAAYVDGKRYNNLNEALDVALDKHGVEEVIYEDC